MKDLDILGRRIIAYIIDCAVIITFAICIGLLVVLARDLLALPSVESAYVGHAIGFFSLTLPALLYFGKTESSVWQASLGKKALGLKVQDMSGGKATLNQAVIRATILLFPWEIAHIGIWYGAERPFIDPPANWAFALMIIAQVIVGIYLVSALFSPKAAIHDEIAKLSVVKN